MKASLNKQLTGLVIVTGLLIGSIAAPVFTPKQKFSAGVFDKALTMQKSGQPVSQSAHSESIEQTKERANEAYGKLPISFEVNRGQTASPVKFLARGSGYNLFLTATEAVINLRKEAQHGKSESLMTKAGRGRNPALLSHSASSTSTLRMKLVGANVEAQVRGEGQLPGTMTKRMGTKYSMMPPRNG